MDRNANNIMLDIETLDTAGTALVLSIGMARFDRERGVTDKADIVLSYEDQIESGRTIDESTLAWWAKQSEEARKVIKLCEDCETSTHETLLLLGDWIGKDAIMWGNGSDFDNAIVASLYNSFNLELPWKFFNNRCYRTLKAIGEQVYDTKKARTTLSHGQFIAAWGRPPVRQGVQHNALDDAVYQAECAIWYEKVIV